MARPRRTIPAYRKRKQTGRAAVSIYRTDGARTEVILTGAYGSEQSKQEYEQGIGQFTTRIGGPAARSVGFCVPGAIDPTGPYSWAFISKAPAGQINTHKPQLTQSSGRGSHGR